MRAELRHRLAAIFPDDVVGKRPCLRATVDVPRGSVAAVHVLCNDLPAGQTLRAKVTRGGQAVKQAKWFRLVDVPVEKNTDTKFGLEKEGRINPYVIRRAPFRIYDPMAPMRGPVKVMAATMAFRLHLPIALDERPGNRGYEIELACGGESAILRLDVQVHAAAVPPIGKDSFPYTNWFDYGQIASRHGLKLWTPAYWAMLRQYADLMAHGRQNMFWLPLNTIFDNLKLNVPRLKRLVRLFSDAGMHWIEGGHVGAGFKDDDYRTALTDQPATSVAGHETLARVLRQLYPAVIDNGWRDRWLQHVIDEAHGKMCTSYRITAGMVHKYMPGIPLIDAMMDTSLVGSADIWVIQNDQVREHLPHFQAQRAFGDRVWLYTCMGPGGNALNRLLDMELIRCTLISWACVAGNFDGYLHWGLNHCRPDQDPFQQLCAGDLPAGDTHLVYPGEDGPWSSLRLEAHREGMEDIELLRRLRESDPAACRRIVRPVVRDCWHYSKDIVTLEAARKKMYGMVSRL